MEITDKLIAMYSHRGDGLPTQYVNPDGPEAAIEIASLRAERDALRATITTLQDNVREIVDTILKELRP